MEVREKKEIVEVKDDKVFAWPNLVAKEFLAAIFVTVGLLFYSYIVDAPLRELSNPGQAENPAKAPWYFLGLQEALVYFDPWYAGVVLPTIIIIGLILVPYLDNNPKGNGYYTVKERKFAVTVFIFGYIFWYILIYIGTALRGPFWAFFWPWEQWTHDFPTPPPLHDMPLPLGIILMMGFYFAGLVLPVFFKRDILYKWGFIRYVLTMGLLLTMIGTVIKMVLRLEFSIKYIIATPWINI
ncbi:MAG: hypothetical protein A3J73_03510 [Planctomycetes bacterium RIFCSPHIGHO2_02_FULL_38_41]|nr:MAG: hypothetical protein A3J73_03510 [Planctomycetes bacterium RIFCSPHIGHO2_02_FULL_38_41]OHB92069.1 MAG: hypothetical protein A2Z57_02210 [Planctomycetes bacterium RIFCSPHIGHO2_12_39_6]OHB98308.1 MAG: hypothetical protein A2W74_02150 [Planctomycetes bacterium RIFCSPLOWO2_12_38_17]